MRSWVCKYNILIDAHDVYGSSVAPSDFNTGELSENERNAVDVLDKAMEHCGDSMVSGGREGGGRKEGRKEVSCCHCLVSSSKGPNWDSRICSETCIASPWKFHMLRPMHFSFVTLFATGMHFHMILSTPLMPNTSRVNYLYTSETCINSYLKKVFFN